MPDTEQHGSPRTILVTIRPIHRTDRLRRGIRPTSWLRIPTGCGRRARSTQILDRAMLGSTAGPVETGRTLCLHRHVFVLPLGWSDKDWTA
jgi:hypothetical protein